MAHIAATNRHVVLADWIFTTPTVIIQPLTGLWMVVRGGLAAEHALIVVSLGPGAWPAPAAGGGLQIRMRKLADAAAASGAGSAGRLLAPGAVVVLARRSRRS